MRCPDGGRRCRCAKAHFVNGHPLEPPFPAGLESAVCRAWAASGAPSACSGNCRASTPRRSAMPAVTRRTRPTKKSAPAAPAIPRSCSSSTIRRRSSFDTHPQDLLGKPRPDPGHAPGQRCRHAISLGDLLHDAGAEGRGRGVARCLREGAEAKRATARSRPRSRDAPPFYYAEDYHQQYLAKNPGGYCGLGGTGVSCPIGVGVSAPPAH